MDIIVNYWAVSLALAGVVGIGMIYNNADTLKKKGLICANQALDLYYDRKYKNCDVNDLVENNDYHLSQIICYILEKQIAINIPLEKITEKTSLKNNTIELPHEKLKELTDKETTSEVNEMIIYIYFKYGSDEYIIPIQYKKDHRTHIPIYQSDDLDTCFKTGYIQVNTNHRSSDEDDHLLDVIHMFAGPKGNFYCDVDGHDLNVKPYMIICQKEYKKILRDNSDTLKLTTSFCDEHKFSHSDNISIPSVI